MNSVNSPWRERKLSTMRREMEGKRIEKMSISNRKNRFRKFQAWAVFQGLRPTDSRGVYLSRCTWPLLIDSSSSSLSHGCDCYIRSSAEPLDLFVVHLNFFATWGKRALHCLYSAASGETFPSISIFRANRIVRPMEMEKQRKHERKRMVCLVFGDRLSVCCRRRLFIWRANSTSAPQTSGELIRLRIASKSSAVRFRFASERRTSKLHWSFYPS